MILAKIAEVVIHPKPFETKDITKDCKHFIQCSADANYLPLIGEKA